MRLLIVFVIGVLAGSASFAQTDGYRPGPTSTCDELWRERNFIYREAGHCFKTAKAIRRFGNAGCVYDNMGDVWLSRKQRRYIADVQRLEHLRGCRD